MDRAFIRAFLASAVVALAVPALAFAAQPRVLAIHYDLEVNPGYIRHIHDEIREVAEGLFLGPAMWKSGNDKALVLWFALDSRLA